MRFSDKLEGPLLDYWVAKVVGHPVDEQDPKKPYALGTYILLDRFPRGVCVPFEPSRDWAIGGPII